MMRYALVLVAVVELAVVVEAKVQTKVVSYKHGEDELEGYLAWDDAIQGTRPGVMVIHEWWGLNAYAKKRAEMLAELGYVAFAADMFGKGKVTEDPKQASAWAGHMRGNVENWRNRALAGLEILKKHDLVDKTKLAGIGYCFGGSTVLALALNGEPLSAVVSFHGGLPAPKPDQTKLARESKVKILIANGAKDTFISEAAITGFRSALDDGKVDYKFVNYTGAVHSFTNPDADKYGVEGVKYDKAADEQSWKDMQMTFKSAFGK
jgi:dienelactone hydrolase